MKNYCLFLINTCLMLSSIFANTEISVDLVSRYVWRGQDYGNAAAIQPNFQKNIGSFSLGAWGSWSISPGPADASGNECDLYISTKIGPASLVLTDYFFPSYNGSDSLFNLDKHTFEVSTAFDIKQASLLFAAYIFGDDDLNSIYLEYNYKMLTIGVGNGSYTVSGDLMPISIGLNAKRDNLSASYIINPDSQTSFLVVGINL